MTNAHRLIALFALLPCGVAAQSSDYRDNVTINLSSLVLKNISVPYECSISQKWSVGLGFRYMPMTSIPFKTTVSNIINDDDIDVSDAHMGNVAVTPEVRYYLGAGRMHGIYIGAYGRYRGETLYGARGGDLVHDGGDDGERALGGG